VSLYYPAQLKGGMAKGLKVVGELPPVWMEPASARASVLVKTLNPRAADGSVAWPDLKQHGEAQGFTLTTEEMTAFIKSADLGGQWTSRQNVKSASCWMSAEADNGKCGNGAGGGGTVYP
ncbi:MAG: hypothetical protein ABI175_00980, partial [Polyangiales bacterium]